MKKFLIFLITLYQKILSPDQGFFVRAGLKRSGYYCGFYPSCSDYTIRAIQKYGSIKGVFLGMKRIFRCHPWKKQFIDFP